MPASISILVIDDEYGVRSGISQILELEGYVVAVAETGRQALALLEERAFDIALIDYQLPDLDGLTLLASMRERGLPTLTCMITAYANIDTAIAATRQGIDFFLPKPFSPDDLLGVIATLARHKQLKEDAEKLRRENERNLLALASEKSQTASLVASLRDAVLVVNREHEVALANQAMADLLGRTPRRAGAHAGLAGSGRRSSRRASRAGWPRSDGEGKVSELTLGDRVFVAGVTEFHDAEGGQAGPDTYAGRRYLAAQDGDGEAALHPHHGA